jgi:hypothetical protein
MKNVIIAAVIIVILYYVYKMKETPAEDTGKRADPMPLEDYTPIKDKADKGQGGAVIDSVPVNVPNEMPLVPFEKGNTTVNPIPQNTAGDDSKVIVNGSSDKPYKMPFIGNPVNLKNIGAANDMTLKPVVSEVQDEETKKAVNKRKNITPIKLPNLTTTQSV